MEAGDHLARAIVEHAADAVIFADMAGVIRMWNAASTHLFGFPAEAAIGSSLDLIIPERLRDAHWKGYHQAMQTGATRLGGQPTITRGLHRDGRRIYVEMSFAVVRLESGAVAGSVAVARDATARYEQQRAGREPSGR
jgi:PAS domain S-box-containing protein